MKLAIPFSGGAGDDWKSRAGDVIPGGSSTGSKRPGALFGTRALDATLPTHFERAEGCTLWAPDGRRFLDCTMALGAVAIGYADGAVTRAVQSAAAAGNVTGLPHKLEVEVAERLVDLIPCAEQVQFLRTGAEATAAAVRIARVATGREHVIACGYFGWLDWCGDSAGIPEAMKDSVSWVPFDDVAAAEAAVARVGTSLAAIIVEPLIHELASHAWLNVLRALCDRVGAILIFDEIKTAFRIRTGGVQELHGVIPDLTTLGKAMANGYPLAAVVGRASVMQAAMATWISSTAAAESTGLAAAMAVCGWHERVDVPERIARAGTLMQQCVQDALVAAPWVGVRAEGPPHMWRLVAEETEQLDAVVAASARFGVLMKRGAYQFASVAHDEKALDVLQRAMANVTQALLPGPRRVEP